MNKYFLAMLAVSILFLSGCTESNTKTVTLTELNKNLLSYTQAGDSESRFAITLDSGVTKSFVKKAYSLKGKMPFVAVLTRDDSGDWNDIEIIDQQEAQN